jgi:hypothetical protein
MSRSKNIRCYVIAILIIVVAIISYIWIINYQPYKNSFGLVNGTFIAWCEKIHLDTVTYTLPMAEKLKIAIDGTGETCRNTYFVAKDIQLPNIQNYTFYSDCKVVDPYYYMKRNHICHAIATW